MTQPFRRNVTVTFDDIYRHKVSFDLFEYWTQADDSTWWRLTSIHKEDVSTAYAYKDARPDQVLVTLKSMDGLVRKDLISKETIFHQDQD